MDNNEHLDRSLIRSENNNIAKTGSTFTITNRLINSEIADLFNHGFCILNNEEIRNNDSDFLFLLEHSTSHQILCDFPFQAESALDYERALDYFLSVLKIKPRHSLTYSMIGICYYSWATDLLFEDENMNQKEQLDKYNESYAAFKMATHLNSRSALPYYFMAKVESCYSDIEPEIRNWANYSALDSINKVIELEPFLSRAYLLRGSILDDIEEYKEAIINYTELIKLDCSNAVALYRRGHMYERIKDYNLAIKDFTEVINLDNSYTSAFYRRGLLYRKIREYNLAISDFTAAMELDKRYKSKCSRQRGEIKLLLGDKDGAQKDFDNDEITAKINKFKSRYGGTFS